MVSQPKYKQSKLKLENYSGKIGQTGKVWQTLNDYYSMEGCNEIREKVNNMTTLLSGQLGRIQLRHNNFMSGLKDNQEVEIR